MTWIQALILGCIEGVTEFLPISSTAHLILISHVMHIVQTDFMKSFEIIIQLGAILAVVALYWKQLLNVEILKRLIVAFIPTGVLGVVFYHVVKKYLMDNDAVILGALFFGGLFLILFEKWHTEKSDALNDIATISYKKCLAIGVFQSIAMIPGVSRSAATIIGGLVMGFKRETIVKFSFLLAMPTMVAATGLDLVKNVSSFSASQSHVLAIGFITAFITAILGIKFFLVYIQKHSFASFGVYRMIIAIVFFILFFV
ncbi:MAG: undecaprenyl-diphosphatase UppP [Parcubacteria group bacterium]